MREHLKEKQFLKWCSYSYKGRGIPLFGQSKKFNSWFYKRDRLTTSDWQLLIKFNGEVAPVRALPGRSVENTRCRFCNEKESLAHVLGACERGKALRILRHNDIRHTIANAFRTAGYEVHEEVNCVALNDSIRRNDILVIDRKSNVGHIFDPTIRFEVSPNQPDEVDKEKKAIYEPTIPDIARRFDLNAVSVTGLLIGARGTIPTLLANTFKQFHLPMKVLNDIAVYAASSSIRIYRNHCYSTTPLI
jgi:hypothetical protein